MKSLMALCAGVMTLCAASSLFVSCEGYDDSELRGQISQLDERVKNLETLKAQLEALTSSVDALYTLKFQVADNNELQYSFDGGKTWNSTGIVLAEQCDHDCPPCQYVPCDHECPQVSLVDNGDTVTIKVGDAEFTIEKPQEIVFELRAGKLYFESEGTMTVSIKSSGIDDVTVMSAPKGWWAEINSEGKVEITAPNYEDTQSTLNYDTWEEIPAKYAQSGYVKVHACAADGKCMVGKLPVEVAAQALVVKAYGDNAYFTLAGEESYWYSTFFYGIATKETLEAETSALINGLNNGDWTVYDDYTNNDGEPTVVASIADLLGEEPKMGEEYVVWALLENNSGASYSTSDLVVAYYSPLQVTISEVVEEKTAYNVTVNVEVLGADSYVAVAMPETQLQWTSIEDIKEQMAMAFAEGQYYGKLYNSSYTGSALDIAAGTSYSMSGNYSPDSYVYVCILPLDGRSAQDYSAEDVVVAEFQTAELTAGGSIDLNAVQITEYLGEVFDYSIYDYVEQMIYLDPYTQLGVEVTPSSSADWTAFYFNWIDDATYADYGAYDEDLVYYLLDNTYGMTPAEVKTWPLNLVENVSPNTTMHFVAFIVDADGKYGKIAHVEATSEELVKADFTWVDPVKTNLVDGVLKNNLTLEVTPEFEEGTEPASYKYVLAQTKYYNQYEGMDDAQMAEELFFSKSSSVKTVSADELVNGKLYVDGHSYGYPYYFAIVPIDADGVPGASALILEYETVFALDNVITSGADYEATEPGIKINLPEESEFYPDGNWGDAAYYGYEYQSYYGKYNFYYEISYDITPVEGTEVCAVLVDTDSYTLGANAAAKAGQVWGGSLGSWNTITTSEYYETSYRYFNNYEDEPAPALVLCVSWKDAEGNTYYKEYELQESMQYYADLMYAKIHGDVQETVSPDGKQLVFFWEDMYMNSCLDLGVTTPGMLHVGADVTEYYPELGMWMASYSWEYELTATDNTSGVITVTSYDMWGDPMTGEIFYTEYDGNSCKISCDFLMLEDVVATVSAETIPLYIENAGIM